jgi:hypothetical protein
MVAYIGVQFWRMLRINNETEPLCEFYHAVMAGRKAKEALKKYEINGRDDK